MRVHTLLLGLTCALAAGACDGPGARLGSIRARIVIDKKVLSFVQAFQVFALKPRTTTGQSVTCNDFPSAFRIGDPRLLSCFPDDKPQLQQGCRAQIAWGGGQNEAKMELAVPADEALLLVVRGMANTISGQLAIVRGCKENLQFAEGESSDPVRVDALATNGAPCFNANDCEQHKSIICHQDADLPGNYCAKIGCNADVDCLPGSVCLLDTKTNGLCARPCDTNADCKGAGVAPKFYNCEGRSGPGGCRKICIWPEWNVANKCE